jgi:hypothetical protein
MAVGENDDMERKKVAQDRGDIILLEYVQALNCVREQEQEEDYQR